MAIPYIRESGNPAKPPIGKIPWRGKHDYPKTRRDSGDPRPNDFSRGDGEYPAIR